MGLEVGESDEDEAPGTRLICPFCAFDAPDSEMHTSETVEYLKRLVNRVDLAGKVTQFTR
jgi:hypothetical protein